MDVMPNGHTDMAHNEQHVAPWVLYVWLKTWFDDHQNRFFSVFLNKLHRQRSSSLISDTHSVILLWKQD